MAKKRLIRQSDRRVLTFKDKEWRTEQDFKILIIPGRIIDGVQHYYIIWEDNESFPDSSGIQSGTAEEIKNSYHIDVEAEYEKELKS